MLKLQVRNDCAKAKGGVIVMDDAKICCRNSLDVVRVVIRGSKARNVCMRVRAGERWARRQEQLVPGPTSFSRVQSPHMQEPS